jgi:uncharacterized membrane-anchored protein
MKRFFDSLVAELKASAICLIFGFLIGAGIGVGAYFKSGAAQGFVKTVVQTGFIGALAMYILNSVEERRHRISGENAALTGSDLLIIVCTAASAILFFSRWFI